MEAIKNDASTWGVEAVKIQSNFSSLVKDVFNSDARLAKTGIGTFTASRGTVAYTGTAVRFTGNYVADGVYPDIRRNTTLPVGKYAAYLKGKAITVGANGAKVILQDSAGAAVTLYKESANLVADTEFEIYQVFDVTVESACIIYAQLASLSTVADQTNVIDYYCIGVFKIPDNFYVDDRLIKPIILDQALRYSKAASKLDYSFAGISWTAGGDSITYQEKYITPIKSAFDAGKFLNLGVGGKRLAGAANPANPIMCSNEYIDTFPFSDVITMLGGPNDFQSNVAIGTIADATESTFYGGLNLLVQRMLTRHPLTRFVLITTLYGELPSKIASDGWPNKYTNSIGHTLNDYAQAVRLCGLKWNVPVFDANAILGYNTINISSFVNDDGGGDRLHINDLTGQRMARGLADFFHKILI